MRKIFYLSVAAHLPVKIRYEKQLLSRVWAFRGQNMKKFEKFQFRQSHNNRLQFDRCKIPIDAFFFEIVISSFFWTGPPLTEEAEAKYH